MFSRTYTMRVAGRNGECTIEFDPHQVLAPDFFSFTLGCWAGYFQHGGKPNVLDIGVGSGVFGVGALLTSSAPWRLKLNGTDSDPHALEVARSNLERAAEVVRQRHSTSAPPEVVVRQDNWIDNEIAAGRQYHIVHLNPPFKPTGEPVRWPASLAPSQALYAGPDGLEAYRQVFEKLHLVCQPKTRVLIRLPNDEGALEAVYELLMKYQGDHIASIMDRPQIDLLTRFNPAQLGIPYQPYFEIGGERIYKYGLGHFEDLPDPLVYGQAFIVELWGPWPNQPR